MTLNAPTGNQFRFEKCRVWEFWIEKFGEGLSFHFRVCLGPQYIAEFLHVKLFWIV